MDPPQQEYSFYYRVPKINLRDGTLKIINKLHYDKAYSSAYKRSGNCQGYWLALYNGPVQKDH